MVAALASATGAGAATGSAAGASTGITEAGMGSATAVVSAAEATGAVAAGVSVAAGAAAGASAAGATVVASAAVMKQCQYGGKQISRTRRRRDEMQDMGGRLLTGRSLSRAGSNGSVSSCSTSLKARVSVGKVAAREMLSSLRSR